ncbi:MAG: V-type ATP synthase subunit I [Clostridia bacterium]|nr:V-type ATP synthase subunit I [Clostridia bacterium]
MSVSSMKKLTVFAHNADSDALIRKLINLRCVQIDAAEPDELKETIPVRKVNCDARRAELESSIARISEAINILDKYTHRKKGLFADKIKVKKDKFVSDGYAEKARFAVDAANDAIARQNEIKNETNKLSAAISSVQPWLKYDLPLNMTGTAHTDILLGSLPAGSDLGVIGKELYTAGAVAEALSSDTSGIYISLVFCRQDGEAVLRTLSKYGFVRVTFPAVDKTAAAYISELKKQIKALQTEYDALTDKLVGLADSITAVEILYDIEQTSLTATENMQKLLSTKSTALISGWVPEKSEKKVCETLDRFECAYSLDEPEEEDNPPILLENNAYARNFEWVLGMYAYPVYGGFDPTFIMSIFYFIIFGIMFADAGYGLVLSLVCFAAVKFIHPSESMKRFLLMFGYCGISCIIGGVLFGSYFGDLPLAFMRNMLGMAESELPNLALLGSNAPNVALLFDPLQNPVGFLLVSLGIGAVHLIAGMAVKFYLLCKEGKVLDAILDIGAYWLLFAGLGLLFLAPSVGKWVLIAAVAVIVLTHGRAEKNIIMKFLKGLLGLYDLINYASDLLSYSRILALGLAAAVIAQVVNILGTIGGPTVGGFIGLVFAFLIGHLLNIVLNVLGTFVHASRLQYIEFFNKFYEDGGRAFEPAAPSDKYTNE